MGSEMCIRDSLVTMAISVPMNEELAQTLVPAAHASAEHVWSDYSGRWQAWNITRTVACGITLALAVIGLRQSRSAHA